MRTSPEMLEMGTPRKRLTAELRVYHGASHKMVLYSFSVDISSGGLYLKTEVPFSVDERLLLSLTLPGESEALSCRARVAWVNSKDNPSKPDLPQGVGVDFVGLSTESLEAIQTFLKYVKIEPAS